jgi:phosphate-selective porin OprO/OprP
VAIPAVTDLWLNFGHLPVVGNFKIGSFKPFIGLEHLTSSRYLDFLERSFNQDAFWGPFNNGFAPGFGVFDTALEERATWGVGAFATADNIFGYGTGHEYEYVGRVTLLPYYEQEGRYLVHLGLAGAIISPDGQNVRIRARDNIRSGPPGPLNPVLADTKTGNADEQNLAAAEFLTIWGPFEMQAEYCASFFQSAVFGGLPRGTVFSQGGYVQALYFLTGENRPYDVKKGAPDRIIPNENFFRVRGADGCAIHNWGAWQLAARYDALDLNDSGVNGGILNAGTFGVNWFLNPNAKLQFNYNFTHRSAVGTVASGTINGFGMRMAMDF